MANCLSCTAPVVPPPLYQDIGLGDPRPHWVRVTARVRFRDRDRDRDRDRIGIGRITEY